MFINYPHTKVLFLLLILHLLTLSNCELNENTRSATLSFLRTLLKQKGLKLRICRRAITANNSGLGEASSVHHYTVVCLLCLISVRRYQKPRI